MQAQPWFKEWFNSPYYYHLYFNHDQKEAAAFIDQLLAHLQPLPNARILDVACGKGRHSIYLAQKGFDVTGIDLSSYSIQEAIKSENTNLHFYQHDMRQPFRINYFDFAFNFFTSFGYFKTDREHENSIRMVSQSLKKEGRFMLDYLNVHYAEDHLVHQSEKEVDGINYVLTKWFDETHFYKKIVVEDESLREPLTFTEKVAKFSLGDLTDMFAYHGLQVQEVYGDYQLARYDVKQSPRMILLATKTRW